ncbi:MULTISPECIES: class I SAM-dependent methyltransferase [Pseudoalteromonas]|uniref:class I SAM-dependent methyltransferase n=1 Tax=Pseudoalteromonas TaxID=53246 RepID=UPI000F785701|nr:MULTISPECIES: class I SAM-dependent methyltransferase [Pseudoalteromonas]
MLIDANWRILTVGDGDLSFSLSLSRQLKPGNLCASIYDDETTLRNKYQLHALDHLRDSNVPVLSEFDVNNPSCWEALQGKLFDAVIFQFPLIPAFTSKQAFDAQSLSTNTLNRRLLRNFIDFSHRFALDPAGPMLALITSKDVKPYCEWNLEDSLCNGLDYHYLGQSEFNIDAFEGYRIRNVDRDKHVKDTSGITYYWSTKSHAVLRESLYLPPYLTQNHCALCRAGPFLSEQDKLAHLGSKKHAMMLRHENDWLTYLNAR